MAGKHRILVVGCGSIGERHLRCFLGTQRAEVMACEPNADLLKTITDRYGAPGFAHLDEALGSERFEGVIICTPAHTHIRLAVRALEMGAGVLIEKPLSTRLEDAKDLESALMKYRRFCAVAYVYHFMPGLVAVREHLKGGSLGKVLQASVVSGQHFPTYRPAYREIYYAKHETGGGAIQDALTHQVNAVEWVIGPTTKVYCDAAHQSLEGVNVEDTVNVTARNGAVLTSYSLNQFQAPNEAVFQFHCENGSVKFEVHEQRWAVWRRGTDKWESHAAPVAERDTLFVAQANAFLDGLEGRPTNLCTPAEAAQTLKFNLAALESARSNRAIEIS